VIGTCLALVVASCGSSGYLVQDRSRSTVPPAEVGATPAANKQRAQADAKRLLETVVVPPGSVRLTGSASSLLSGPVMGTPRTTSLIDDTAFWAVPIPMSAALAWFVEHHPGGLAQSGTGSSSSHGVMTSSGYSFSAPSSAAWTGASVEIGVAPIGPGTSGVRADGMATWIDPIPFSDTQSGPRMRVTMASSCPTSDQGFVGVTNPPPPLERSLLPRGAPSGGLVCGYYGSNGHPFALDRKTVLDASAAEALSVEILRLPLGHLDGEVTNCPMDDGSATVVALVYPDGANVDLWMATTGCPAVSNGYISASGSLPQ
jgi:hypothetical protein